jgi:hypothetical protein
VLDASQNNNDLNNLIVWSDNGGNNQHYGFTSSGNGLWTITNFKSGHHVYIQTPTSGSRLSCTQNQQSYWQLVLAPQYQGKTAIQLVESNSGLVAGVAGNVVN